MLEPCFADRDIFSRVVSMLGSIVEAVPVRLMKRDLLFVVERLAGNAGRAPFAIVLRQHGIGNAMV